jgi:NAD-dependent deacetylase
MVEFEPGTSTVDDATRRFVELARGARRIVAFTGAGISTDSGIPDYRGPNGVWKTQSPPSLGDFLHNEATRRAMWARSKANFPEMAARRPNGGHLALAELERVGVLGAIITQNIDGLHQKAGNSPEIVHELHGASRRVRCVSCGAIFRTGDIWRRLDAGEEIPACEICGGILRTGTVLFGEPLPTAALEASVRAALWCDLMIVVGSTLVVNPAARLPALAKKNGAKLAIVNRTPTPLDRLADVVVIGEATPALQAAAAAVARSVGEIED